MLVKCITNSIHDMSNNPGLYETLKKYVKIPGDRLHITPGNTYIVYAARTSKSSSTFFIVDDNCLDYPIEYYSPFFEVIDDRLSRHWQLPNNVRFWSELKRSSEIFVTFKEWLEKRSIFYENLVDGESWELEIFGKHKNLMDVEFLIPSILNQVLILEDLWVQCPFCDEAWEAVTDDEMLKCLKCKKLLRNPLSVARQ